MNETLKVLHNRVSLRNFDERKITDEHMEQIIDATIKAPTAGNQMLYSIILIEDEKTKEKLSVSCDNQPFIKKASHIMIFLADHTRWFDYYKVNGVKEFCNEKGLAFEAPQEGDLMLAIQDAVIAAQNAVIAAESMGIGSCYIGDILENYEFHKELLGLPDTVFPISMLVFGYYKENHNRVYRKRFNKDYIVFKEKYKKLNHEELNDMFAEHEKTFNPKNKFDGKNYAQAFYARKTGADFSKEMHRAIRVAMKQWDGRLL